MLASLNLANIKKTISNNSPFVSDMDSLLARVDGCTSDLKKNGQLDPEEADFLERALANGAANLFTGEKQVAAYVLDLVKAFTRADIRTVQVPDYNAPERTVPAFVTIEQITQRFGDGPEVALAHRLTNTPPGQNDDSAQLSLAEAQRALTDPFLTIHEKDAAKRIGFLFRDLAANQIPEDKATAQVYEDATHGVSVELTQSRQVYAGGDWERPYHAEMRNRKLTVKAPPGTRVLELSKNTYGSGYGRPFHENVFIVSPDGTLEIPITRVNKDYRLVFIESTDGQAQVPTVLGRLAFSDGLSFDAGEIQLPL